MSVNTKNPRAKWYIELMEKFGNLVELHALPDEVAEAVKSLLLGVARDQYMAGNKSGIRWMREKMQGVPAAV
ncbi:MAG: hypothetical protein O3B64_02515 [bacterium]|nr:hypothetical protein [bacterium]